MPRTQLTNKSEFFFVLHHYTEPGLVLADASKNIRWLNNTLACLPTEPIKKYDPRMNMSKISILFSYFLAFSNSGIFPKPHNYKCNNFYRE